jgi:predicted class III extradiol MEMO1 family dioxygenase
VDLSTKQLFTASEDLHYKKFRPDITSSQGACVRPDDFWIKESTNASLDDVTQHCDAVDSSTCGIDTTSCIVKAGSMLSQNDSVMRTGSDPEIDNPDKATRQLSVYELEDIDVEPGIVHRTKLEIEQRERCVFRTEVS